MINRLVQSFQINITVIKMHLVKLETIIELVI